VFNHLIHGLLATDVTTAKQYHTINPALFQLCITKSPQAWHITQGDFELFFSQITHILISLKDFIQSPPEMPGSLFPA